MSIPFPADSEQHRLLSEVVRELEEVEGRLRGLDARKAELLAEADRIARAEQERLFGISGTAEMAHRTVAAEVGFALGIADRSAERLIEHAATLCSQYPAAHGALADGRIALAHTSAIVEAGRAIDTETLAVDPDARVKYAAAALAYAEQQTPNRTRRQAKALAARYAERSFEQRCARAQVERRVWVSELDDGLAELHAVLSAPIAHALFDRLTRQARHVQGKENPGERRLLGQIRADLLGDLLLNGTPANERGAIELGAVKARVQVTVPVLSLLSSRAHSADPLPADAAVGRAAPASEGEPAAAAGLVGAAILAGYGPIDGTSARMLASLSAGLDRIACDPQTGAVLGVDRYRPSEEMRRFLSARDQRCRFPGCNIVPHRADQDHTIDAARGGPTTVANLSVLCRRHHMMKHHAGIGMVQWPGGEIEWTSRLGRRRREKAPALLGRVEAATHGAAPVCPEDASEPGEPRRAA
ncbi:HNH endonuclease signature motif containing protein [Leucobacter iarius]|uniref:HNH nuclease domain-containing protein n=1 Tax=Leucobacter iarius TaxID=333963 RepID=A0ABN2LP10_9MICO